MKPSAHRCTVARHHRWGPRRDETKDAVTLRCILCRQEFRVEKNPSRWAELKGEA